MQMNAPIELRKDRGLLRLTSLFLLLTALPVNAQQTTGTPGSPSATTTIPSNQLPAPPEPFGGVIKEEAKDSTPFWPATIDKLTFDLGASQLTADDQKKAAELLAHAHD
jgi:hypothetical protein